MLTMNAPTVIYGVSGANSMTAKAAAKRIAFRMIPLPGRAAVHNKASVRSFASGVLDFSEPRTPNSELSLGPRLYSGKVSAVAIGVSTGGPKALQDVLPLFPGNFPVPILVVQHMPKGFTGPFAERLNQLSRLEVKEAEHGEAVRPGIAYIAPGGLHMRAMKRRVTEVNLELSDQPADLLHRPSVDVMMLSVAEIFSGRCVGVIMTGMGNDGLEGMRAIKKSGGKTIAQDEESSVVYGMPKAVVDAGVADKVVPLPSMAGEILNMV